MSDQTRFVSAGLAKRLAKPRPFRALYSGNIRAVVERGFKVIVAQNWVILASGFFEPVFYLLAMGMGVGSLIGEVPGPGGVQIPYGAYIAPALLATSAMNGAIYDTTWNLFWKLKFARLYETMLQASLGPLDVAMGELLLALFRGLIYAIGFMIIVAALGYITAWSSLLMVPCAMLIALGFAAIGMSVTSYLSHFQQMDLVSFVMLPMFLFSATLFPITIYPAAIQWLVMAMPLWHGVELMRHLAIGYLDSATWIHLGYFVVMSVVGISFATRRLRNLFLR